MGLLLLKGRIMTALLLLLSIDCSAQNEMLSEVLLYPNKNKIVEVYGEDFLANNNELLAIYDQIISDNIHYQIIPLASDEKYPLLSSFPIANRLNPAIQAIDYSQFNSETFNPLYYSMPFFTNTPVIVRVDGTNHVIIIDPIKR